MKSLKPEFERIWNDRNIEHVFHFGNRKEKSSFHGEEYWGLSILEYWTSDLVRNGEDCITFYRCVADAMGMNEFLIRVLALNEEDSFILAEFSEQIETLIVKGIEVDSFHKRLDEFVSIIKEPESFLTSFRAKMAYSLREKWNDVIYACEFDGEYFAFNWATSA